MPPGSAPPRRSRSPRARRTVALYAVTVVAIVTVVFLLPRALPGSPLTALEDPSSGQFLRDPDTRQRVLAHYGLDAPLLSQYRDYVTGPVTGDLGWSIARKAPVGEVIAAHLPWTLLLTGTSLVLASTISFVAGIAAAWRRGRRTEPAVGRRQLRRPRRRPDFILRFRFASDVESSSFNRAHNFDNEEFNELAAEQATIADRDERQEVVGEMQRILAEEVPIVPLFVGERLAFVDREVFDAWYFTPGCPPCGATRNKHALVTGRTEGFAETP